MSPPSIAQRMMRGDDGLGVGMDAAFTILVFFGVGFLLDRWLGSTPWLTITLSLVAAVGLFLSWKARYTARMEQLEAERRQRASGPPTTAHDGTAST